MAIVNAYAPKNLVPSTNYQTPLVSGTKPTIDITAKLMWNETEEI